MEPCDYASRICMPSLVFPLLTYSSANSGFAFRPAATSQQPPLLDSLREAGVISHRMFSFSLNEAAAAGPRLIIGPPDLHLIEGTVGTFSFFPNQRRGFSDFHFRAIVSS